MPTRHEPSEAKRSKRSKESKRSKRPQEEKERSKKNISPSSDRQMYVAGFDGEVERHTMESNPEGDEEPDYHAMTMEQLHKEKENEYQLQEEALDTIHQGAMGLKNHAIAINNEVIEENVMLTDLGENMGDAQQELESETEKAKLVNRKKTKVCKLYCVIILLIVALSVIWTL